jgi:hypothetical protein
MQNYCQRKIVASGNASWCNIWLNLNSVIQPESKECGMSDKLQQIKINDQVILVEVADLAAPAAQLSDYDARFLNTSAGGALNAVLNANIAQTLQTLITPVYESLKAMAPDEANVEVSLGFGVKGDLFVAKGEGNAALKVSAKWKFEPKPAAKP